MTALFLPTKAVLFAAINNNFIFYTLKKNCENQEKKIDRQLVMSRNSSRIKVSRKVQGRLLLSYKNPDFFSGLSELYRILSKMTEFMSVGRFFFLFINFVCLYVAQKTTPARS